MKSLTFSSVLVLSALGSLMAYAQEPAPGAAATSPPAAAPEASLTDAQVSNVLTQLTALEEQVIKMRGSNLAAIIARLRTGMDSDQAAMNLYLECDRLVNSDRKEAAKVEARKRQEDMEKRMEQRAKGGVEKDEGDFGTAVRLGLQYLVLTLEAHEIKEEDFHLMAPKLKDYIKSLVDAAPKLKGRAGNYLNTATSNNNPIVDAHSLGRYLNTKKWSRSPLDIGSMYSQTLLPVAEEFNKDSLPGLWDERIMAEGTFKKENLFKPEFELWTQIELPVMRWQRAMYLYDKGPSRVNALADMLKIIKENPGHPDAPLWVKGLRQLVNQSAPAPASPNLETVSGS